MKRGAALLAAALALCSAPLLAQPRGFDCSQAKDPKACEERVAKMKTAQKACEGKTGEEHAACLRQQFCARAKDPKACEERAAARRQKIHEACKDKRGEDLKACIRDQRSQK